MWGESMSPFMRQTQEPNFTRAAWAEVLVVEALRV